jgi:hypothetical protein
MLNKTTVNWSCYTLTVTNRAERTNAKWRKYLCNRCCPHKNSLFMYLFKLLQNLWNLWTSITPTSWVTNRSKFQLLCTLCERRVNKLLRTIITPCINEDLGLDVPRLPFETSVVHKTDNVNMHLRGVPNY